MQKLNISDPSCPSRAVLNMIADKWTTLVIVMLIDGPKRYGQLQREVGGISHKMLSQTLRELECRRLVVRTVHATMPPQVDYELTSLGRTLVPHLEALINWSEAHCAEILC